MDKSACGVQFLCKVGKKKLCYTTTLRYLNFAEVLYFYWCNVEALRQFVVVDAWIEVY